MKMEQGHLLKLCYQAGKGKEGEWWKGGRGESKIYCKHICKCHNETPLYN
jgi:hypothetical protein